MRKILVALFMFVISIQVFAAKDVINFGLIPTESSIVMEERTKPFLNEMEKFLGIKVKPFYASDYAGIIEAMRFGKIDIAWFGNKSAIEAVDRAGGEVIVQTVKDDGTKGYYSHLITHKDSGITYEDVLKCGKNTHLVTEIHILHQVMQFLDTMCFQKIILTLSNVSQELLYLTMKEML